jgi:hypothetical protein
MPNYDSLPGELMHTSQADVDFWGGVEFDFLLV